MANFSAHLVGASGVTGVAALSIHGLGWAGPGQTQLLFLLGVLGGVLPDIDSARSRPVRGLFVLLGVVLAFWMSFFVAGEMSVPVLAGVWALVFLTVRFVVPQLFARLTVHRGTWHSGLAMILTGLASANCAFHLGGLTPRASWLAGVFVATGYLTHLCMDELASLGLLGSRVRRSFGTALKPFSLAYPWASLAMLATVAGLWAFRPPVAPLLALAEQDWPKAQVAPAEMTNAGRWPLK
jgi:hypothetical protein